MNDTPTEQTNRSLTIPRLPIPSLRQVGKAFALAVAFAILYVGHDIAAYLTGIEWLTENTAARLVWEATVVSSFLFHYGNITETLRSYGSRITVLAGSLISMMLILGSLGLLSDVLFGYISLEFYNGSVIAYVFSTLGPDEDFVIPMMAGAVVLLLLHSSIDDVRGYIQFAIGSVLMAVPAGVYDGLLYSLGRVAEGEGDYAGPIIAVWLEVLGHLWETVQEYVMMALLTAILVGLGLIIARRLDGWYSRPNREQPVTEPEADVDS